MLKLLIIWSWVVRLSDLRNIAWGMRLWSQVAASRTGDQSVQRPIVWESKGTVAQWMMHRQVSQVSAFLPEGHVWFQSYAADFTRPASCLRDQTPNFYTFSQSRYCLGKSRASSLQLS